MAVELESIAQAEGAIQDGACAYRVTLRALESGERRTFVFRVQPGDISVLNWDRDFDEYIGPNIRPAHPLFAAIQAFHDARALSFVPCAAELDE